MSTTVDNRTVEMGFQNDKFERGVKTTLDSLEDLKRGLNLTAQTKSLEHLAAVGKSFNLGNLQDSILGISDRFSNLGIVGMTILQNLTNAAINFGQQMLTSLTVPARKGFAEYETQMNSIQTIMANTASQGTTLQQVNDILKEMNEYADQTIYSFPEMARNMGTFTAAGISLETSAQAIKGIANLAAVSGSNSNQAAVAMYQLSQALAAGTVKLMDWNSVVNAGMGGKVFQDALMETARVHGVAIDKMLKTEGSFRNTLQNGWLTSEILTETLSKFTGDLTAEQLKSMGYTEEQIAGILKLGETANDAATKVKTLSHLKETLMEAASSGWAQSWQIVFGDFEEAKAFFTEISDVLGGVLNASSDARNKMLQQWKDWGGRMYLVESIRNAFKAIGLAVAPIKAAFAQIFPKTKSGALILWQLTFAIYKLTNSLKMGGETAEKFKRVFAGIFAVLDIFLLAASSIFGVVKKMLGGLDGVGTSVLDFAANLGDSLVALRDWIKEGNIFGNLIESIRGYIDNVIDSVKSFATKVSSEFQALRDAFAIFKEELGSAFDFSKIDTSGISDFFEKLNIQFDPAIAIVKMARAMINGLVVLMKWSFPILQSLGQGLGNFLTLLAKGITAGLNAIDFDRFFDLLNTGLLAGLVVFLQSFLTSGASAFTSLSTLFGNISGILTGVRKSLEAYQQNLQAKTLLTIAAAVAILVGSLLILSMIDSKKLAKATLAVTAMFAELTASMSLMTKGLSGGVGQMGLGATLVGVSVSILIIAGALTILAKMKPEEIQNGLLAIASILAALSLFVRFVSANANSFIRGAISISILALGLKVIVGVVKDLGSIDLVALQNGLMSLGAILGGLVIFLRTSNIDKLGMTKGIGLLLLATSLLVMSNAIEAIGSIELSKLQQGLLAIAAILAEIAVFSNLTGGGITGTAVGMVIIAASMMIFAEAMKQFATMSLEEIGRGLAAMGGSLILIAAAMQLMPANSLVLAVGLAVVFMALKDLVSALGVLGQMDMESIGRALLALGGSIVIFAIGLAMMQKSVLGAAAFFVVAAALNMLAPALKQLGSLSLQEIGLALLAIAGTLVIFGLAGFILAPIVPILLSLGAAVAMFGVGLGAVGLGVLAFSAGMAALAISGVDGTRALGEMILVILELIPKIVEGVMNGITQLIVSIGTAAPAIGETFKALVLTFLDVIIDVTPSIIEALGVLLQGLFTLITENIPGFVTVLGELLTAFLDFLVEKTPEVIEAAYQLLLSFLSGLRDNISEVTTLVGDIIAEFLRALGVEIPKIVDAGYDMMIALIEGITDVVENKSGPLYTAVADLVKAIVDSLVKGLTASVASVTEALSGFVQSIIDNLLEGILGGLSSGSLGALPDAVGSSVTKFEESATKGFDDAAARVREGINTELSLDPIIRPVVDLTNVRAAGKESSSLFSRPLALATSIAAVTAAAGIFSAKPETVAQPPKEEKPAVINFEQNNYSPKAISPSEVYRLTRNQLILANGILRSKG